MRAWLIDLSASGIGAVAGGISEVILLLVPLLSGTIGVLLVRLRQAQRTHGKGLKR